MKEWVENDKPDFMDVAFSSERSIQDELVNVSSAELPTIIISYCLMFLYIALALGHPTCQPSRIFVIIYLSLI